jgi:acetyl-CoA carboxylase biotin carboxyl carrier protein
MAKKTSKTSAKKASKAKTPKATAKKKASKAAKSKAASRKSAAKPPQAPTALTGEVEYLMEMMVANGVTEVDIDDGKRRIALKRGTYTPAPTAAPAAPVAAPAPAGAPAAAAPAEASQPETPKENLLEITSPMVGTFYAAPSPDSEAYVKVGTDVNDESVVCIVEAMKVMNEIKAECSGTIAEVCVKNAEPVEFGQVLFRVKPS